MKRIITSILLLSVVLFVPSVVLAQNNFPSADKISSLPRGEVVDGDYFAAGEVVEISGTVNGDVYVAGGQVIVDGTINGDLLAAGGTVNISGEVSQNIRAAGGQVILSGSVSRNVSIAGGNIDITNAAFLDGNLVIAGGSVSISAPVAGNIKAGVGNLTLANTVGGNVDAAVGQLLLTSNASVTGDVSYVSDEKLSMTNSATVAGTIKQTNPPVSGKMMKENSQKAAQGFHVFSNLISIISTLLLGFLFIKILPNFTSKASNTVSKEFLKSLGWGFVLVITIPVVILLFGISIIGIPLAFVSIFMFIPYLYISRIFILHAFGAKINSLTGAKIKSSYLIFTIGLLAYYLIGMLPVIGGFVKLFSIIASFGAAVITHKTSWQEARKAKIL